MPNKYNKKVDLNDIKLFVSVVQAGSLTKASELLAMPKSYLSRHLTDLEQGLGTKLIDRGRRGVVLNEIGTRFFHHAQEMLHLAQVAIDEVQDSLQQPSGLVRMSVSTEIGRGFLMHHLAEFLKTYPDVQLEVQIDNRKVNMIQDGIDIALRVGTAHNDNVIARKLFDIELGLFASQDYIQRMGMPQAPNELYGHDLIYKYDGVPWLFHCKDSSILVDSHYRFICNDYNLAGQMVKDGVGIAMLPLLKQSVHEDWVRLMPDWKIESVPLYII